jgi:hypothetical protein
MKRLLALTFAAFLVPCYGGKKNKEPPPPTQADITKGCVSVRDITYEHRGRPFSSKMTGVSGVIMSGCTAEAEVSITITFYDSYNNQIDVESVTKLVKAAATVGFWGGPDWKSDASAYAVTGRVARVSASDIP